MFSLDEPEVPAHHNLNNQQLKPGMILLCPLLLLQHIIT
ncbi:hypothetical protein BSPWISOX_2752 [uncultured Gammaproteobacteria bacterium]|nr:hypothetical protein BSPWISOX_2752 [uncultured Gammaproteobacteria bacterium]